MNSKSIYPPTQISQTNLDSVVILQFTDLHIRTIDLSHAESSRTHTFKLLLAQALSEQPDCQLIIITGDLVDNMDSKIYDWIFEVLEVTKIPFICLSGNHDVTDEVGDSLPFHQKEFIPYNADSRLISNHVVESQDWQILCIDSSVSGKVSGFVNEQSLDWLEKQLTNNSKPALICLHHHLLPINSQWIDSHITLNYEEFWQRMSPFEQIKATICGHVHQESSSEKEQITNYSTPSTSYQFKPNQDEFGLDNNLPGYRWLFLQADGTIISEVKRLKVDS